MSEQCKAYQQGRDDYAENIAYKNNPYTKGTDDYLWWQYGWLDEQWEDLGN